MKAPAPPADEQERLLALAGYDVLDTPPEPSFDALTTLAAHILEVPIALVSLVDGDRQWFKSRYGLAAPQTPRDVSFCGHVVAGDAPLIVSDALGDQRFADNPLVTGQPRVRFYAGMPLRTPEGFVLGTLCAIDHEPRELAPKQRELLALLAGQVMELLELRRRTILLSERTRALQSNRLELENQSTRLNAIINTVVDGIITIDAKGTIQTFNPAAERIFRWSAAEALGKSIATLGADVQLLSREGQVSGVGRELEGVRKDGARFPLELALSEITLDGERLFTGIARDISERKRVEAELRQFKTTLDGTQDGIFIFEPGSLRILYANQGAVTQLGYSRDELVQMRPLDFKPELDESRYRQMLGPLIRGEEQVVVFETLHRHKQGQEIPVEVALQYIAPPGEAPRFINIVRDISERKRLDKLKSEFVSTVSHELRTPLTSIRGSLALIAGGVTGELPPQVKQYVDIALSNTNRLVRLINDILDIEKIQSGSMEFRTQIVGLGALLVKVIEANEAFAAAHGVELALFGELPRADVVCDEDRLTQVLTNLISNAVKFSPPGQRVELSTSVSETRVRVNVRDHGAGIPEEFRGRIFQRFAQADSSGTRERSGSGLGLSIAKAMIEGMKGELAFADAEGGGTTFHIELPWVQSLDEPEASELHEAGRALVCEDDLDTAYFQRGILERAGVSVHVAPTLERARQLLSRFSYRLVTLDLNLGDGDGGALIPEIRNASAARNVPIIVISALAEAAHARLGLAALAVADILPKPVEESRLLAWVQQALSPAVSLTQRVLHVEDDLDLQQVVRRLLPDSWEVVGAESIAAAKARLAAGRFDVVLLDLSLPDGNGEELLDLIGTADVVLFSAEEAHEALVQQVGSALVKSRASEAQLRDAVLRLMSKRVSRETSP